MTAWKEVKAIAIWGFGREGQASLSFLREKCPGASFTVLTDDIPENLPEGVAALSGSEAMQALTSGRFDVVVKSPGISFYKPEVVAAKDAGSAMTSATNLWFEEYPGAKTVIVTGTKGKSTTASLLHHLLLAAGKKSVLAGNIGVPLLSQKPGEDITVIELSSYQLADLFYAPNVFVVTNLFREHTPWHDGKIENYYADKLRPVHFKPTPAVFADFSNPALAEELEGVEDIHWFNAVDGFHVENEDLYNADKKLNVEMPLKGAHNLVNLSAALSVLEFLDIEIEKPLQSISSYKSLPHRLQEMRMANGMLCVDDSISTIPETTLAALETYKGKNITLIMGGQNRGQDYKELSKRLKDFKVGYIFLLPENGSVIEAALKEEGSDASIRQCPDLEEAVMQACAVTPPDGVLLLSPGAPSYGQFRDFQERGERFLELTAKVNS